MTGSRSRDDVLAAVFALTGAAILADQAGIILTQILPLSPATILWRYGSVGLTVGRATPLLLADLLLMLAAIWWAHRSALRVLAIAHFLAFVAMLAALVIFSLDAIQVVSGVPEAQVRSTQLGAIRAAGMLGLAIGYALWSGWLLWRHAGTLRSDQGVVADRGVLLVGTEGRDHRGGDRGE